MVAVVAVVVIVVVVGPIVVVVVVVVVVGPTSNCCSLYIRANERLGRLLEVTWYIVLFVRSVCSLYAGVFNRSADASHAAWYTHTPMQVTCF